MINFFHTVAGTIFAYGVTSSGKTHTMHVRQLIILQAFIFLFVLKTLVISFLIYCCGTV
jgi:hypothetical protein